MIKTKEHFKEVLFCFSKETAVRYWKVKNHKHQNSLLSRCNYFYRQVQQRCLENQVLDNNESERGVFDPRNNKKAIFLKLAQKLEVGIIKRL